MYHHQFSHDNLCAVSARQVEEEKQVGSDQRGLSSLALDYFEMLNSVETFFYSNEERLSDILDWDFKLLLQ